MQFWRQRCSVICSLQAKEPRKLVVWVRSENQRRQWHNSWFNGIRTDKDVVVMSEGLKNWNTSTDSWDKMDVPASQREQMNLSSALGVLSCPDSLADGCPRWWGWIFSIHLLNLMLITSRNALTSMPRINVLKTIWISLNLFKTIFEMTHHSTGWRIGFQWVKSFHLHW